MNEFIKQHRGKLWIAQAVAFVLLGVFVASWFGGWVERADSLDDVHDVGLWGDAKQADDLDVLDAPSNSSRRSRGVSDLRDGLGARQGVGRWSSHGFDQF